MSEKKERKPGAKKKKRKPIDDFADYYIELERKEEKPTSSSTLLASEEEFALEIGDELEFFDDICIAPGRYVRSSKELYLYDGSQMNYYKGYKSKNSTFRYPVPAPLQVAEPTLSPLRSVIFSTNSGVHKIDLRPGVTLIVGQSTSGKTTLLSKMISANELTIWAEPRAEACHSTLQVGLRLYDTLQDCNIMAIDSVSTALYTGRSKIEKGLSAEAFTKLALIDSYYRRANRCLIATFAPLVLENESLRAITRSMVNQKISQGIFIPEPGVIEYSDRASGNRSWSTIKWALTDNVTVQNAGTTPFGNGTVNPDFFDPGAFDISEANDTMKHSRELGELNDADLKKYANDPHTRYNALLEQLKQAKK